MKSILHTIPCTPQSISCLTFLPLVGLKLRSTETIHEKLRSVFGDFWMLNLLLPTNILFPQLGDGTEWRKLKIVYKYDPQNTANNSIK